MHATLVPGPVKPHIDVRALRQAHTRFTSRLRGSDTECHSGVARSTQVARCGSGSLPHASRRPGAGGRGVKSRIALGWYLHRGRQPLGSVPQRATFCPRSMACDRGSQPLPSAPRGRDAGRLSQCVCSCWRSALRPHPGGGGAALWVCVVREGRSPVSDTRSPPSQRARHGGEYLLPVVASKLLPRNGLHSAPRWKIWYNARPGVQGCKAGPP